MIRSSIAIGVLALGISLSSLADSAPLSSFEAGVMEPDYNLISASDTFKGSTASLLYGEFSGPRDYMAGKVSDAASTNPKMTLEIALEAPGLTLDQIIAGLTRGPNDPVYQGIQAWADLLKGPDPVYLRPMSEMNDQGSPWEFGYPGANNTPAKFAQAWTLIHKVFSDDGASNVMFLFVPMSGSWGNAMPTFKGDLIKETLALIPKGEIDAFGLTVYTRARAGTPVSFSEIVTPWMSFFKTTHHGTLLFVVGEMGVPNNDLEGSEARRNQMGILKPETDEFNHWDLARAHWITNAFSFARSSGIKLVIYFNDPSVIWGINPDTDVQANQALKDGIAGPSTRNSAINLF